MQGNTIIMKLTGIDMKEERICCSWLNTAQRRKNNQRTKKMISKLARTRMKRTVKEDIKRDLL